MSFTHKKLLASCAFCVGCLAPPALAEDVTAALPSEIRALLQQEMLQIEAAMKDVHSAIVRGDHESVAKKGQAIHDSFIMKQALSAEQRKILKSTVPSGFLGLDQEFHELAAGLSSSGKRRDTAGQIQHFSQMTQACVSCHSRYAPERFGGLDAP